MTSVSLHRSTLRLLQTVKGPEETRDDVLLDWLESRIPAEFWEDMVKRAEGQRTLSLAEVRERHRGH